jgi:hypothetical protein
MQRLWDDQVKSICIPSTNELYQSFKDGMLYVHVALTTRIHVAVVHPTMIHMGVIHF